MIRIKQIEVPIDKNDSEEIIKRISSKLKIKNTEIINCEIIKQSIDARKKGNIHYVYEVDVSLKEEKKVLKYCNKDISETPIEEYQFVNKGTNIMKNRPIVVGSGPAGLFCAYLLAQNGYKPIIIERGEKIEDRVNTVNEFWNFGILKENSNVQFGEGGAGTFSDGKLNTLIKDKEFRGKKVFEIFVKNGAPKDIMYLNHPHIGTDVLRNVIINIRKEIIQMGGEFRYNTCLTNLIIKNNKLDSIEINNKDIIYCDTLVLAIGHSARDTFKMLLEKNIIIEPKPFAVGIRIQHPQEMINNSQYDCKNNKSLPPATYKLTYKASNGRGVYSFCMCPSGYVVNSSSEKRMIAINGMSYNLRDSKNANSALVVTVTPNDFGTNPLDGLEYQRTLEKNAYIEGQGKIPVQLLNDFYFDRVSDSFGNVEPVFKGNYNFSNLNKIFPNYINESLKEGIEFFNTKIKNYSRKDAIIAAVESRTSSPVRILRNDSYLSNIDGVYPCGEGAGYAGGITSSAMDGIKVAEAIAKVYIK